MRGNSRAAVRAAYRTFAQVLDAAGSSALGDELLGVVDLLDATGALRRALTSPNRPADDKAALVHQILDDHSDPRVAEIVAMLVRERWSAERDLADAVEEFGFTAVLAHAQRAGALEQVEEELFRIDRILVGQRALRSALGDQRISGQARARLMGQLLEGKVHPITADLAKRIVAHPRGRTLSGSLAMLGRLCAERRRRLLAAVTTPVVLTKEQTERLGALIERYYGREAQLDVSVDPSVIGGLRIQIGDDVVDGTTLSQLALAKRKLVAQ